VGAFGGSALILAIVLIAGSIAYVGDRVGHYVGRRRLSLFGLRPKYTSTIVAVGTGMVIALTVTVTALLASNYARAAFFDLSRINDRVNQLNAEADTLDRRLHETNVVVNRGDLMYPPFLVLTAAQSSADQLSLLEKFFDSVVAHVNAQYTTAGLKPFRGSSNDPEVRQKLQSFLSDPRMQGLLLGGSVVTLAIADQNLFVNDPIHFTLVPYADKEIFRANQPIARVEVPGGTNVNARAAFSQLLGSVQDAAIQQGMPVYFARPVPLVSEEQIKSYLDAIRRGRGSFHIVAAAAQAIRPSLGGLPILVLLEGERGRG